jgi:hypothetical protein
LIEPVGGTGISSAIRRFTKWALPQIFLNNRVQVRNNDSQHTPHRKDPEGLPDEPLGFFKVQVLKEVR